VDRDETPGLAVVASAVATVTASQETHAAPIDVSQRTCKGYLQANDPGGASRPATRLSVSQQSRRVRDRDPSSRLGRQFGQSL